MWPWAVMAVHNRYKATADSSTKCNDDQSKKSRLRVLIFKASRSASRSCPMSNKHLSKIERYKINSFMKAQRKITLIK